MYTVMLFNFSSERNRSTLLQPFNVLKVYGHKQTHQMKKSTTKTRDKQNLF